MDLLSARWRKPVVGRPSQKRKLALQKALARWKDKKQNVPEEPEKSLTSQLNHNISFNAPATTSAVCSGVKMSRSEAKLTYFRNDNSIATDEAKYTIVHDTIWTDLLKNLGCEECGKKN